MKNQLKVKLIFDDKILIKECPLATARVLFFVNFYATLEDQNGDEFQVQFQMKDLPRITALLN